MLTKFNNTLLVSRSCRGCREAARLRGRVTYPAGIHPNLAVALSVAKPTDSKLSRVVSRQGIINRTPR